MTSASHARANRRRSAMRRARRVLLRPGSTDEERDAAVQELLVHADGPNAWLRLEACKAIFDSYYLRDWIPELRVSRTKIEADERRAQQRAPRSPGAPVTARADAS